MIYNGYIYKENELRYFNDNETLIPRGWNKITLQEWEEIKPKPEPINQVLVDYSNELNDIKRWFNEHDYYINKVFVGEWDANDERYLNYLQERQIKRQRHDELVVLIESSINV